MFRHKGKNRTFAHDLRLATLLSFVAGLVNVTGVFGIENFDHERDRPFCLFCRRDDENTNIPPPSRFLFSPFSSCLVRFSPVFGRIDFHKKPATFPFVSHYFGNVHFDCHWRSEPIWAWALSEEN